MALRIAKPALPDDCLIDNRVYTDERLYRAEFDKLFLRVWSFVCHESEIANPGDFIATIAAGQPIIVCRNQDGALRAFYNTCRHRAAQVERERCGNRRAFTCLYHLWVYDLDGRLTNIPQGEAYKTTYNPNPNGLDPVEFGLVPVRVESHARLVFVCFDDATPPLADYLAEAGDVLMNPFGAPDTKIWVQHTKTLRANWKMQPENSRDGYHAPLLHKRLRHVSPPRPYRNLTNGHTVQLMDLDYEAGLKSRTVDPVLAENPGLARQFMAHPMPGMTRDNPSYVVTLFPDTLILVRYSTVLIERQTPNGVRETTIELRGGGTINDSPEIADIREKHWRYYWSEDAGNLPEDWEAWEAQQKGVESAGVRYTVIARGERGMTGVRGADDNRIRWFWQNWRAYMGADQNAPLDA
ncbi:MAG TPA: aromatic ring-hydroxylating dioxygenase subunit alpha [Alphaproteobacteria bacterium]